PEANIELDLAVAAAHATIVVYAAGPRGTLPLERLLLANLTLRFVWIYGIPDAARRRALTDIAAALSAGALTRLPERDFELEEIAEAHEAVERRAPAKVLLRIQ
ncbi:MAG: zinc-binding dehydrogenase, partial [Solirubrobacteraceae bacterium]